jgi:hypothetical protein
MMTKSPLRPTGRGIGRSKNLPNQVAARAGEKLSSEILREQRGDASESIIQSEAQAAADEALDYYALMVSETACEIEREPLRGMSLSAETILTTDRDRSGSVTRFRKTALVQGGGHEDAAAGAVMAGGLGLLACALFGLAPLWVGFVVPFAVVVLLASLVFTLCSEGIQPFYASRKTSSWSSRTSM